jgi:SsrA-binding protein|tara:strand:- start:1905 stop:2459 length:555 start_codon:yes stop_codon:yes gene_type:complete
LTELPRKKSLKRALITLLDAVESTFYMGKTKNNSNPVIENRKVRNEYHIEDTLEVGIVLRGTEVKSIRNGQASLAEGWIRATERPLTLKLHGVHIAEYNDASFAHQHDPIRTRVLLAHKREIKKLATFAHSQGNTLVPLKIYFLNNKAKVLLGMASGKRKSDKRQDLVKKAAQREMDRAMKRRM